MTTAAPQKEEKGTSRPGETSRRNRPLVVLLVVLAIAVVGLGGWVLYDQTTGPASAVPAEVDQLIDDYIVAWEQRDEDAMRAAVTQDFLINEYFYEKSVDRVFMVEHIDDDLEGVLGAGLSPSRQWQVEQVGEPIITGGGPWFVSIGENWILDTSRSDGMATYVIVDDGGTLKIANHFWAGLHYRTE